MSFEIIVGIPLLIEATILCIQNILEVPLEDIGILKMESIHTNNTTIPHSVFICFVPITLSILAFSASITFDD